MADTKIEWADRVWNPIAGCSVLSPGCTNCYAMRQAARVERMGTAPHYAGLTRPSKAGPVWTGNIAVAPDETLTAPLRWRKPKRIFVNSMSDLFHEAVPDAVVDRVFAVMALCPQHTFLVLTKRAKRMRAFLGGDRWATGHTTERIGWAGFQMVDQGLAPAGAGIVSALLHGPTPPVPGVAFPRPEIWPLANVWLGVSVEDQRRADERIPHLLATPAAVRWISAEPLLGPVDLRPWLSDEDGCQSCDDGGDYGTPHCLKPGRPVGERCPTAQAVFVNDEGPPDQDGAPEWCVPLRVTLDWVVVGGESGPKARPMHPDWARSLRDQCAAAGVPFFFKQWGAWAPIENFPAETVEDFDVRGLTQDGVVRVGKAEAGRELDGRTHDGYPERAR
jgi:protein gp37